jgi:hypothetical protein
MVSRATCRVGFRTDKHEEDALRRAVARFFEFEDRHLKDAVNQLDGDQDSSVPTHLSPRHTRYDWASFGCFTEMSPLPVQSCGNISMTDNPSSWPTRRRRCERRGKIHRIWEVACGRNLEPK